MTDNLPTNDEIISTFNTAMADNDLEVLSKANQMLRVLMNGEDLDNDRAYALLREINEEFQEYFLHLVEEIAGSCWATRKKDGKQYTADLFLIPVTGVMDGLYQMLDETNELTRILELCMKASGLVEDTSDVLVFPHPFKPEDINELTLTEVNQRAMLAFFKLQAGTVTPEMETSFRDRFLSGLDIEQGFTPATDGTPTLGARFLIGARGRNADNVEPDGLDNTKNPESIAGLTQEWVDTITPLVEKMQFTPHFPATWGNGRLAICKAMVQQFVEVMSMQDEHARRVAGKELTGDVPTLMMDVDDNGMNIRAVSKSGDFLGRMVMSREIAAHAGVPLARYLFEAYDVDDKLGAFDTSGMKPS